MKEMALRPLARVVVLIAFPVSRDADTPADVAGEMTYIACSKFPGPPGSVSRLLGSWDAREPCIRTAGGRTLWSDVRGGDTYRWHSRNH